MGTTTPAAPIEGQKIQTTLLSLPALVWFFALLVVCYAPVLNSLVTQWSNDEDMGHGFFVPALAAYIAYQRREDLAAAPMKSNGFGLVLLAGAAAMAIAGTLGAELFISRVAFVISVIGCVLFLGGMPAIHVLRFPLFLLFFMIPIPAIIYNQITFPLQLIASQVAETVLSLVGIPVLRDGNVLELPSQKLSVVEACSGIRSLLSLSFLSLIYGYFFDPKLWMRYLLFFATIPIAIAANASRVTMTGLLSEINVEYSKGIYHTMSGWVVFVVALVILVAFHQFVERVYRMAKEAKDLPDLPDVREHE